MEATAAGAQTLTDEAILDFLREVAIEGYETDEDIVLMIGLSLARDHPGQPDVRERVRSLAPALFDELHAREGEWPIPTDNDRLDRAFARLEAREILARQDFYGGPVASADEITHELEARRRTHTYSGYAYFHGQDTRRAIAGEGLRITWGPVLRGLGKRSAARREKLAWAVAQEIHAALWAQGLSPEWSRQVTDPIVVRPFTWRRRRRRWRRWTPHP